MPLSMDKYSSASLEMLVACLHARIWSYPQYWILRCACHLAVTWTLPCSSAISVWLLDWVCGIPSVRVPLTLLVDAASVRFLLVLSSRYPEHVVLFCRLFEAGFC